MNVNDESDLGKINLLEYIKTLKEHYMEMQKEISRLEKENLELRALLSEAIVIESESVGKSRWGFWFKKAEKYKQEDSE